MPLKPIYANAVANARPLSRSAAALLRSLLAHFLEQEVAASSSLADLPTTEYAVSLVKRGCWSDFACAGARFAAWSMTSCASVSRRPKLAKRWLMM